MGERLHLLFHLQQILENGEALFQHAAPGERQAVLRKVAGGDALAIEREPSSRLSMPASTFSRVDLPVPFPPTRPTRSAGPTTQLSPRTASWSRSAFRLKKVGSWLRFEVSHVSGATDSGAGGLTS